MIERFSCKPLQARIRGRLIAFCVLLLLIASSAQADLKSAVDSAYALGQYEQVELLVLRSQSQIAQLPVADRAAVNLTAGCSMIMLEREPDAREYFRKALDADPTLHMDPVRVSPKFRVVFDDVKANFRAKSDPLEGRTSAPTVYGPRRSSVLINLVIPGAGQWQEGRRLPGAVFFVAEGAAVGVLISRLNRLDGSRDTYLREQDPAKVVSDYDHYSRDVHTSWYAGIAAGVIYLAAQTDLALTHRSGQQAGKPVTSLTYEPLRDGLAVSLSTRW